MTSAVAHVPTSAVLAVREFEAWLLAGDVAVEDPESVADAKSLLGQRLGVRYDPIVHQARLTAGLDLDRARARAPSFDKLVRDVLRLVGAEPA